MTESAISKKTVKLLSLGHFSTDAYSAFITPILPFIAVKLGITMTVASLMISVSHLSSSIAQPLFGHLSDKYRRRFFIIAGLLIASFFMSAIGLATNAYVLGIFIFLASLGVGLYHPQATSLIGRYEGSDADKFMGIFLACGTIGYASGPVISSAIVEYLGLHYTFIAVLGGLIVSALLYFNVPKIDKAVKVREKSDFWAGCKFFFSDKTLVLLFALSVIKALVSITYGTFVPFLLKDLNYSPVVIGFVISGFSLMGGLGAYCGGRAASKIGRKKVFVISTLPIMPLTLLFFFFLSKIPVLAFIFFAITGFVTFFSVSVNITMAQMVCGERKGIASGFIGGFSWGVVGVFLSLIGYIANKFGIANVLCAISLIPLITASLINRLPKELD